jgi:hypothetical protein
MAVTVVAAPSAGAWRVIGYHISAEGAAGTVALKNGSATLHVLSVPAAGASVATLAPNDLFEWVPAAGASPAITVTPSAAGIQCSGTVIYNTQP